MAGLLDFFGSGWEDPKSQAVMALAGGLLDGDFASGMKGYANTMAGAQDAKFKRAMQEAQMENLKSEIAQRNNAMEMAKRKQDNNEKFWAQEAPMSSGAFAPSAGYGPTMPLSMMQQPKQSGLAGKSLDEVMQHIANGGNEKILDAYKWAKDPQQYAQGNTYKDRITGQERFMPKTGEGMMPNQQGVYGFAPGYAEAQAKFEGAKTRAIEDAKSGYNFQTQTLPGDRTVIGTNAQMREAVNSGGNPFTGQPTWQAQPQPAPMVQPTQANKTPWISPDKQADILAILNQELRNPRNTPEDIASLKREIARAGGQPQSLAPNTAPQSAPSFGLQLQSQQEKDALKTSSENVGKVNDVWLKSSYTPIVESKGATTATLDSINQSRAAMTAMGGTGWGTETKATAANVLAGLGIGGKNAEMYATNAQTFQQAAMTRLQSELALQKGPQTEGDAERQSATYAALKNTPQANTYILDSAQAKAERDLMKARFYESALPIASKKGDLQEIDREWNKRAPSLFSMPSMQKWAKK